MKAVVYHRYGTPDVLRLEEVDKPSPKDAEVLIRVRAAEATKSDCELRSFNFPVKWFWLPLRLAFGIAKPRRPILGGYLAGEVEAVGKDVTKFKAGDRVFGSAGFQMGAYGEYVCLPESATLVHMPAAMSFEEAAAIPLGGLNALHYLRRARIQEGESVLVNGAGGSIGTFGVQIAKSMGAQVTAVDSGIKKEMLLAIGADHFIDYTERDFTSGSERYDVILDMVAGRGYSACVNTLNPNGRYLMANPRFSYMFRSVVTSRFTNKQVLFAFAGEKVDELLALKEMAEQGKLKSAIDRVYRFEQAAEAHERVETEQRLGIVVLSDCGEGRLTQVPPTMCSFSVSNRHPPTVDRPRPG
ncbi:MAG: NADPH:quinone reductase-like Zn-dependent oxidoreductase [Rhodothermales bacterium]|jgi:NADPH:quinone reductase-like Zn-dependent oxidoreductase